MPASVGANVPVVVERRCARGRAPPCGAVSALGLVGAGVGRGGRRCDERRRRLVRSGGGAGAVAADAPTVRAAQQGRDTRPRGSRRRGHGATHRRRMWHGPARARARKGRRYAPGARDRGIREGPCPPRMRCSRSPPLGRCHRDRVRARRRALAVVRDSRALAPTRTRVGARGGRPRGARRAGRPRARLSSSPAPRSVPIALDARRPPARERRRRRGARHRRRASSVVHVRVPLATRARGARRGRRCSPAGAADAALRRDDGVRRGRPGRADRAGGAGPRQRRDELRPRRRHPRGPAHLRAERRRCSTRSALYPASLELRPATVQRLAAEQQRTRERGRRDGHGRALDVAAGEAARRARVERARLARGRAHRRRPAAPSGASGGPGIGQGEFVVMAAPNGTCQSRAMQIVAAADPSRRPDRAAAPRRRRLYLGDGGRETFEVELPGDARAEAGRGVRGRVPEAHRGVVRRARPQRRVHARPARIRTSASPSSRAYSEFDAPGATLDDVAKQLSSDRGTAAAQVLERAGAGALAAVATASTTSLDARGRALAIDVAASHDRCGEAAPILARGLCEASGEAPRKAREKLERCKGAAPVLAAASCGATRRRGRASRPMLAALAPAAALEPHRGRDRGDARGGRATRGGAARLRSRMRWARRPRGAGGVSAATRSAVGGRAARDDARGGRPRGGGAGRERRSDLTELLAGAPSMRVRYLALGAARASWRARAMPRRRRGSTASLARDSDWPVRARAAEARGGLAERRGRSSWRPCAIPSRACARRRWRRWRVAVDRRGARRGGGCSAANGWSFVRRGRSRVLDARAGVRRRERRARAPRSEDASASVRGAAMLALGPHRASAWKDAIRERLDDSERGRRGPRRRGGGARRAVRRGLGRPADRARARARRPRHRPGRCSRSAWARLVGLAALHPADLARRLAPLLADGAPAAARAFARARAGDAPVVPVTGSLDGTGRCR